MPLLMFPRGQAVGVLEWPGSEALGPVLAAGEVAVPDGVEVGLRVSLIDSVRREASRASGKPPGPPRAGVPAGRQPEGEAGGRWIVEGSSQPADLGFLRHLPGDSITELDLRPPVFPESFAAVTHLAPGLRRLYLAGTGLSDEALRSVAELRNLTHLQSWNNQFTDDGLRQLASLTRLESLYAEEQTLSAAAFTFAARLPRLTRLGLQDVPLTQSELSGLAAMLPGARVTPGIAR